MSLLRVDVEPSRNWQLVVFRDCQHVQTFKTHKTRIAVGQQRWCKQCAEGRTVMRTPAVYAVMCSTPTCRYGRYFAQDKRTAGGALGRHRDRFPTHTPILYRNGREIARLAPRMQQQIPGIASWVGGIDDDHSAIPF